MTQSILTSTKLNLGIDESYTVFDQQIIDLINTAFMSLSQMGIGPATGFAISDANRTWDAFLGNDLNLNGVKTYIWLKVRLAFDPPNTSFGINAMQEQVRELEWRLNVHREYTKGDTA